MRISKLQVVSRPTPTSRSTAQEFENKGGGRDAGGGSCDLQSYAAVADGGDRSLLEVLELGVPQHKAILVAVDITVQRRFNEWLVEYEPHAAASES